MEIFLKFTLYFCLIVFYYLVVMNERKNILLSIYLIFKYLVLIAWLIFGTGLYLFLLLFSLCPPGPVNNTPADFWETFVILTIIYAGVNFSSINSIIGIQRLLKNKTLTKINYVTIPIMVLLELLLCIKGYVLLN